MNRLFLRQLGKWRAILPVLLSTAILPACMAMPESPLPSISSTRGTTLVRSAIVTDIRELAAAEEAANPTHPAVGHAEPVTVARLQEIVVQFEDGQIRRYQVGAHERFQIGERVTLSDTAGKVHIAH